MSNLENDKIFEAAFEKAEDLEISEKEIMNWDLEDAFNFLRSDLSEN